MKRETTPAQFRLPLETLADLDVIAGHQAAATGERASRATAVRIAAKEMAAAIRRKMKK